MTENQIPGVNRRIPMTWVTSAAIISLLYAITGWPAAAFMGMCIKHGWRRPFIAVSLIYYPHTWVMALNKSYYDYIIGGFESGDDGMLRTPSQSWEQFQDQQDDT